MNIRVWKKYDGDMPVLTCLERGRQGEAENGSRAIIFMMNHLQWNEATSYPLGNGGIL